MATYNVTITSKANRAFESLGKRLVASHLQADDSTPAGEVKVILHCLLRNYGSWLSTGDERNTHNARYIRVVIDIPKNSKGSRTEEEKQELRRRTAECCVEYEGKHAKDCEIEVVINEIDERDVLVANKAGAHESRLSKARPDAGDDDAESLIR